MPEQTLQVVWFKRDLRVQDHAPLYAAMRAGPTLAVAFFESHLLAAADYAVQHANFATECLHELGEQLEALNVELCVFHCEVLEVFEGLREDGQFVLHSHEETGNHLSYQRDLRVQKWCKAQQITWHETPSHGVVRRLKSRDNWALQWEQRMRKPQVPRPLAQNAAPKIAPALRALQAKPRFAFAGQVDKPLRQKGGRQEALQLMESFFTSRALEYRTSMSSPLAATTACSRLSPYIAMGSVSVKEVVHRLRHARQAESLAALAFTGPQDEQRYVASLKSFESRLHWRCHFVQKLESQPNIEFSNMHAAYNDLRAEPIDPVVFHAWCKGETGFPMVDACMRMLLQTGWINFRMRAMLVSFASYQLWMHWREPALFLARQFLDYEPGIHYSQLQMQSGTTGINTIRMYNPVKQARDQDPQGRFVRQWIPALAQVPTAWIFEPWAMPRSSQHASACVIGRDYPAPVVDLAQASQHAREQVWGVRSQGGFGPQAQAIFQKLGSRNKLRESKRVRPSNDAQLDLFG
jgi:deoxyribodipyrimidine photo-lyase